MPTYSGDPAQLSEGGVAGSGPARLGLAWPVRGALLHGHIHSSPPPLSPCTRQLRGQPLCPPVLARLQGPGSLLGPGALQLLRRTPPPATQTPLASDSLSPLKQIITAGPRVPPRSALAWMPDGRAQTRSAP